MVSGNHASAESFALSGFTVLFDSEQEWRIHAK